MTMLQHDTTLRSPREVALAAYADELADALARTAGESDATGRFPYAHFDLLRERGAFALTIPEELGGRGHSLYGLLLVQERLGRGCASTALTLGWHLMVFAYLGFDLRWPRPVYERLCRDVVTHGHLVNVLVTERTGGNLLRGGRPATQAIRVANGYLIRGHKAFCSGAPALAQMIVYAWIEAEQRTAEFLVPAGTGVEIIDNWQTLGMRGTGSHDVVFHDVLVPREALLGYVDKGKPSSFNTGSRVFGLHLAAVYLGVATAARDFALDFASRYRSGSFDGVVLDAPVVQQKLGEIEFRLGASKNLLYGLAERWEQNHAIRHRLDKDVGIVKSSVTRQAIEVVDLAMSIVGGHSLSRSWPLERYFRDVRCGLFNPPNDDVVLGQLAQDGTRCQRERLAQEVQGAAAPLAA